MIRAFIPAKGGKREVAGKTRSEAIDLIRRQLGVIPEQIEMQEERVVEHEFDEKGRPRPKK